MDAAQVLIDGKWRTADAEGTFHAENPAKGEALPLAFPTSRWSDCDHALTAATKAAVDAITKGLAAELGPKKILVNSVLPGATDTEGFRAMPGSSDFRSVVVSQTPLGRLGQPQDIANVVSFLAGDEAAWITGQLIAVSGGWN